MSTDSSPDRAVAAIAAGHRTIVTRKQVLACGLTPTSIAGRLRAGRLHIVFRSVYSVGCGALPPLAREQAALFVCGDDALLSHHTAAYLWGLRPVCPFTVHVSVPGAYRSDRDGLKVHRVGAIDPRERRRHQGLAVTSPARALLEIAGDLTGAEFERAFDEAIQRKLVNVRELRAVLERNPGRRGARRLIGLLDQGPDTGMTRSRAEQLFRRLVRRAELPAPEVNVPLGRFVVDFLWRSGQLVVEIDGFAFHAGRRSFESDRRRDVELSAAGYTVLRFTWRQLLHEPEVILVRLGQVLALGAPRPVSLPARAG